MAGKKAPPSPAVDERSGEGQKEEEEEMRRMEGAEERSREGWKRAVKTEERKSREEKTTLVADDTATAERTEVRRVKRTTAFSVST